MQMQDLHLCPNTHWPNCMTSCFAMQSVSWGQLCMKKRAQQLIQRLAFLHSKAEMHMEVK